jgi:hypothetical protein
MEIRANWDKCSTCAKYNANLKCPCGNANYCDASCQKVHWHTHQKECVVFFKRCRSSDAKRGGMAGSLDEKSRLMPDMIEEMERKEQDTRQYREELLWIWKTYPALIKSHHRGKSYIFVQMEGLLRCLRRDQEYKKCIAIGKDIITLLADPDKSLTNYCDMEPTPTLWAGCGVGSVKQRAVSTMMTVSRYLMWEMEFKESFMMSVKALGMLREKCDYRYQEPGTRLYNTKNEIEHQTIKIED